MIKNKRRVIAYVLVVTGAIMMLKGVEICKEGY